MESVRPIAFSPAGLVADVAPRPVTSAHPGDGTERAALDPAVTLALSAATVGPQREPDQRGYVRDPESHAVVFRITDPASGEVIIQIPDEIVLKARVYERQDTAPAGERIEKVA